VPDRRLLRLFFALWPDAGARAALAATAAELRKTCGGRVPAANNLHLTLAFLGSVPAARLPELEDIAAGLARQSSGNSFVLTLNHIGWWRRPRLVWAGMRNCPCELEALADALASGLQSRGFHTEQRRFRPHVTLLRDADRAPAVAACETVSWRSTQFVMAQSTIENDGVKYRIVGKWPLQAASASL